MIGVDRGIDPARLNGLLSRLPWFLPPRRMVMLAPADWDIASLTPLADLAERAPHGP